MGMRRTRRIRWVGALVVAAALAAGTYAFTASNTVGATKVGSGQGAISGYSVSGISYSLNSSDPSSIDSVSFTISPASANVVKVQLGGAWYGCSNAGGSVSCTTTGATVGNASSLTVVASE